MFILKFCTEHGNDTTVLCAISQNDWTTEIDVIYEQDFVRLESKIRFGGQGPLFLILIPAWISNHIHYKMWDEITYPFLNFNSATVEV